MEIRVCKYRHCQKAKPVSEFRRKKNGRYNGFCNECADYFSKKQLESLARNRETVVTAQRARYLKRQKEILPEDMQRCQRCTEIKPKEIFGINRFGRLFAQCPPCRTYAREWRRTNSAGLTPEQIAVRNRKAKEHARKIRRECIEAYGGKCACCGEDHHEFLAIDHINGGGHRHRQELKKAGTEMGAWLKLQGYPKDEYRLLCHNCNVAMGIYGYCPHSKRK